MTGQQIATRCSLKSTRWSLTCFTSWLSPTSDTACSRTSRKILVILFGEPFGRPAKALGLTIPETLLATADELIQ